MAELVRYPAQRDVEEREESLHVCDRSNDANFGSGAIVGLFVGCSAVVPAVTP